MSQTPHIFLYTFLLLSSLSFLQGILAVQYIVTNNASTTPGGQRFNNEIGAQWTVNTLKTINKFIWKLFRQPTDSQRKHVPILNLYITILNDGAMGETGGDNIYISDTAIDSFPPGRIKFHFASLLYHEMTHIFQWSGQGSAPGGLTEGIADYVMVKSKYYFPGTYTKPGEGGRWDEGYGVTERFLEYCDGLKKGFTVELNNKMRKVYRDEYFMEMLGKPLEQVWSEYKAKYGYTNGDYNINISAQTIQSYPVGRANFEFTSLMYHEMTHIFQWSGNRSAPGGLTEGIADYVMVKSNFYVPNFYVKPGSGSRWDEGYGVTERFLEYCDSLKKGFTVQLNKKMKFAYSDNYFVELLGKPVGQLWSEYKAKYGNIPAGKGDYMLPEVKY
ncbi:hypothetical protein BUALT_Bualt15G0045400 [Buddleja alternifolia]|uniref:Uncharacterized protein n=1 Tax=Buddleja alternifolia TaxID=168488 RepID=A0AAV6WJ55_9LAMI|nr:hypothetical protein BUALT_Bualt15G0045400 [Buddleja alternifolia]